MKIFRRIVLVVILLLVAVVFVLKFYLGDIIKSAVEQIAPSVVGAEVTVEHVGVDLFSGTAHVRNLIIGNPEGFKSDSLIEIEQIDVKMDLRSLRTDTIVINEILILRPKVTYEASMRGSNLGRLIANIEGTNATAEVEQSVDGESPAEAGTAVKIDLVLIQKGKVKLALSMLGGAGLSSPLPEIRIEGIGEEEDEDVTFAEAVGQIVMAIAKASVKIVTVPGGLLMKGAGATIKATGAVAGATLGVAADAAGGTARAVGKGLGAVGRGIGGVFSGDKDEDTNTVEKAGQMDDPPPQE